MWELTANLKSSKTRRLKSLSRISNFERTKAIEKSRDVGKVRAVCVYLAFKILFNVGCFAYVFLPFALLYNMLTWIHALHCIFYLTFILKVGICCWLLIVIFYVRTYLLATTTTYLCSTFFTTIQSVIMIMFESSFSRALLFSICWLMITCFKAFRFSCLRRKFVKI